MKIVIGAIVAAAIGLGALGVWAAGADDDTLDLIGYDSEGNETSREPIEVGDRIDFPPESAE